MNDQIQKCAATRWPLHGKQKGAVLFFTLIALVAMTMAALAMVRSVDTGNLVAGNIALKQGAIQEADRITNTAFNCLDRGGALTLTRGYLDSDHVGLQPCLQYFSILQPDTKKPFGFPDALKGEPGDLPAYLVKSVSADTQNTSVYIIERMCTVSGTWSEENCIETYGSPAQDGDEDTTKPLSTVEALYRISVRVYGPRNINAYSQMVTSSGL